MAVLPILSRWRTDPEIGGNVVEWHVIPPRAARLSPFPAGLHPALADGLRHRRITSLYTHQEAAWNHAQAGENLVIVTGTASGKTLCYNLPVLDRLLRNPEARALYLFPTKALAQDQLAGLKDLWTAASPPGPDETLPMAVYDGDTPSSARPAIRGKARLIVSNPDMLHTGILPHHANWAAFFRNLQYIIIDEIHTYRGVFGSHVANLIRRLKRIARWYGAAPQFILTSATIANPLELAGWLIEAPVRLVDDDGSARGPRHFLIYNPPVVNKDLGLRRSVLQESVRLAEDLLVSHNQTLIFTLTRRSSELLLTYLKERALTLPGLRAEPGQTVRGYRSGYLPGQRREIERGLRSGEVRAVVATTALELGIDIGAMNAVIMAGYPGTIAGTWQQAGRAGRKEDPSLAVLVTSANPLDQFLAHHPAYFFERTPESALINPNNLLILLHHLRCAAFELPFQEGETFGNLDPAHLQEFLDFLLSEGVLHHSGPRYFWMADRYPAESVSLRSASPDNVVLQAEQDENWTTIGQVDQASAVWMVHPGAIYLHEAQTYLVTDLNMEDHIARLKRVEVDYYTEPRSETTVALVEEAGREAAAGGQKAYGELTVTSQVVGFRKVRWHTHENLGLGELDLPPIDLQTTGYWVILADEVVADLMERGLWTNAPNQYGPAWPAQRDRARARDGYRCQSCGAAEQGRGHDVHHKIPFRAFATAEQANQLSNLVTLCPPCHHRVETAVRIRSGLAGLAFVLGQLAPLFLMCDARDLGIHSDPQSPLSEGKPTVVVYDHVPAGIGFSERLFEIHSELMRRAHELISACECSDGCPSCVGPGGENGAGGKRETLAILEHLVTEHN